MKRSAQLGKTTLIQRLNRRVAWVLSLKPTRAYQLFTDEKGPAFAVQMTYHTLFSLLAAVVLGAATVNLWFQDSPQTVANIMLAVDDAVPGLAEIIDLSHVKAPVIWSVAGAISLFATVQTATGAINAAEAGIRSMAGTDDTHTNSIWRWLRNVLIALAIAALFAGATWTGYTSDRQAEAWLNSLGFIDPGLAHTIILAIVSSIAVFLLDGVLIALLFISLSGVRTSVKTLLPGVLVGALGLLVLQRFSSLFIGSLDGYPVLASVVGFIGLLLWLNLSAQVVLYASAYIVTGMRDSDNPGTVPQTAIEAAAERADRNLAVATAQAERAHELLDKERLKQAKR